MATKSKLLIHGSQGVQELIGDLTSAAEVTLDPAHTIWLPGEKHRDSLKQAEAAAAYTLVGRIPFLNGKAPRAGQVIMVRDDVRLRRPYLVVTAPSKSKDDARAAAARKLAGFLREPKTQEFIGSYGAGQLDDQPLFFPVVVPPQGSTE